MLSGVVKVVVLRLTGPFPGLLQVGISFYQYHIMWPKQDLYPALLVRRYPRGVYGLAPAAVKLAAQVSSSGVTRHWHLACGMEHAGREVGARMHVDASAGCYTTSLHTWLALLPSVTVPGMFVRVQVFEAVLDVVGILALIALVLSTKEYILEKRSQKRDGEAKKE